MPLKTITPKEKANQLIAKFSQFSAYKYDFDLDTETKEECGKKNAITCVDEIIEIHKNCVYEYSEKITSYYIQVKEEIKKFNT